MASVLIVDDEEGIRRTTGLFLREAGHDVETAASVREACGLVERRSFDVVLTDIVMPGDDGIRLLEIVRARSPLAQVVMFTGEPTVETATDALRLGAFDYLPKPVRKDTVCRVVAKAASLTQLHQENARLDEENRRHRAELERLVQMRTVELKATIEQREAAIGRLGRLLEATAEALSMALEMRDPYTAGHQRRVTALACAISERMNLPTGAREGLRIAGLLHDLGKIRVPADILTKPSRLTAPEFSLIKEHPVSAWEILRVVDFPWPVADIVRQHHERLDGSGYPDGLEGDSIGPEARILGVADVVEAMASHRPYRAALGIDVALEEILLGRGTRYCPGAVDACVALFREEGYALPA